MATASTFAASSRSHRPFDLRLVQRDEHLAGRRHALAHLEAQRALDQRHVLAEKQVVRVRPVDAPDLVGVAEAFGDEQRGPRPGALEHGVDGDGRAVQEEARVGEARAGLVHAVRDAVDQAARGRERLAEQELPARFVEGGDIGEGTADVGGKTGAGGQAPDSITRWKHESETTRGRSDTPPRPVAARFPRPRGVRCRLLLRRSSDQRAGAGLRAGHPRVSAEEAQHAGDVDRRSADRACPTRGAQAIWPSWQTSSAASGRSNRQHRGGGGS